MLHLENLKLTFYVNEYTSQLSSKLTVFLKLCSQKTVCLLEQIMFTVKYPSIFMCQTGTCLFSFNYFSGNITCLTCSPCGSKKVIIHGFETKIMIQRLF